MRASHLLGLAVFDESGEELGYVADLRLVQDGPMIRPYTAALRVEGFVVVRRRHIRLLGYERDVGPWLMKATVRHLTGEVRFVDWDRVLNIEEARITVRVPAGGLTHLHELPSRCPAPDR
jgi:sporulation protein YlmC with PRC-barrel domain